jgi:hypothetical protein
MAGPIRAGARLRLQAVFTILVIAFFCFLLAHDLFLTRFGWLKAIVKWASHVAGAH